MARHFTKQEIEEIRKQLSTTAVRDLELPETSEMTDNDYVAVVQNGVNKKFNWAVISHAENERIANENERVSAENARAAAEVSRSNTEAVRVEAEAERVEAEAVRIDAETGRVEAERQRASAESARVIAEGNRVSAETRRDGKISQMESEMSDFLNTLVLISDIDYKELVDKGEVDPSKIYFIYEEE